MTGNMEDVPRYRAMFSPIASRVLRNAGSSGGRCIRAHDDGASLTFCPGVGFASFMVHFLMQLYPRERQNITS
jgi:hypothetical protein